MITDKINTAEISGRVYRPVEDTNAVVMLTQPKRDKPKEPRFLPDCRPRNTVTIRKHTPLPNIEQVIEFVPARSLCSKIDLTDRYYHIRIDSDSEKHTTLLRHMGHYRSNVIPEGDCNASVTMVRAMNVIFRDMIYKDLINYIDNIIISSRNYKQHVEALPKVLQRLQDQQFWLKASKCEFFPKGLDILGHMLTPDGLSTDPLKVQKILDFPEPRVKGQLLAFIVIVNSLSKFLPNVASTAAILSHL